MSAEIKSCSVSIQSEQYKSELAELLQRHFSAQTNPRPCLHSAKSITEEEHLETKKINHNVFRPQRNTLREKRPLQREHCCCWNCAHVFKCAAFGVGFKQLISAMCPCKAFWGIPHGWSTTGRPGSLRTPCIVLGLLEPSLESGSLRILQQRVRNHRHLSCR